MLKLVEILTALVFPAEPAGKPTTVTDAVATKAYKQPLAKPLPIGPFSYLDPQSLADCTEDELPTEKQLLGWVASRRSATARNKQQAVAFEAAGIEAPVLTDEQKAYNQAFAAAKRLKFSDARAALFAQRVVDEAAEAAAENEAAQ
jgi:hypothetical protein